MSPASTHTPDLSSSAKNPLLWLFFISLLAIGIVVAAVLHFSFALPLVFVSGLLALFLLFRHPQALLFSLLIVRMSLDYSSQYFTFSFYNIHLSLSQLLGGSIAVLGLMILALYRRKLPTFPLQWPFLLLFLWGGMTFFYSIAPHTTLQELLRIFDLFVLGFLAYATIKTSTDFKRLLQTFFVSGIIPALFGLYQFIFNIGLTDENVSIPRIFGTFSHPNVFSLYLFSLIVFGSLYLLLFAKSTRGRFFTLCVLALFSSMLLLTFARVAWIALFLFIFFMTLFRYRLLLFPLILIPFVLFVFSQTFHERVIESFQSDPDSSIVWRKTLWKDVTSKAIQDNQVALGSGMDTFPLVSESVRGTDQGPNDPHNDFVKFFIEGGVVGLTVFLLYLFSLFSLLYKKFQASQKHSAQRLAFGIMIIFLITLELSSLTDNVFKNTPVQWLFFTAFGALLSVSEKTLTKK